MNSQTISSTDIDPILEYLLEFNEKHSIEYTNRFLIPPGGLQTMLDSYKGFMFNRKDLPFIVEYPEAKSELDQLMELI